MSKAVEAPAPIEADEVEYLTAEDLSKRWKVSAGTIANWRLTEGKGPDFIRIGGFVRYHPEAVKAWLASRPTS